MLDISLTRVSRAQALTQAPSIADLAAAAAGAFGVGGAAALGNGVAGPAQPEAFDLHGREGLGEVGPAQV